MCQEGKNRQVKETMSVFLSKKDSKNKIVSCSGCSFRLVFLPNLCICVCFRVKLKDGVAFLGARASNPVVWTVSQDVRSEGHRIVTLHCRKKDNGFSQRYVRLPFFSGELISVGMKYEAHTLLNKCARAHLSISWAAVSGERLQRVRIKEDMSQHLTHSLPGSAIHTSLQSGPSAVNKMYCSRNKVLPLCCT